jgi:hypothetical protein
MATLAQSKVQKVIGVYFRSPPILRKSCSPDMAWITLPAPRNKSALKNAWVMTWKMPAENAPVPRPRNM